MRLFYKADGTEQWYELNEAKLGGFMPSDFVVAHDEELFYELKGMLLMDSKSGNPEILLKKASMQINKKPEGIIFFTKIPARCNVIGSSNNFVTVSIT